MPVMTDRELRVHCVELATAILKEKADRASSSDPARMAQEMYEFIINPPRGEGVAWVIDLPTGEKWHWSREHFQWERFEGEKAA